MLMYPEDYDVEDASDLPEGWDEDYVEWCEYQRLSTEDYDD